MLFIKTLFYGHVLPNSQRLPTNPLRQEHLPPMHQPPFKHGSKSEQSRTEGNEKRDQYNWLFYYIMAINK